MRQINSSKHADDFISSLPAKQFKQIYVKILSLKKNPLPHDVKKLKGYGDLYRTDIGEYRIIYSFDDTTVYLKAAGKRNNVEVYKYLSISFQVKFRADCRWIDLS